MRLLYLSLIAFSISLPTRVMAQVARDGSINLLPMYGGAHKSKALLKADERFLTDCDQRFLNRQAAAAHFAGVGWQFIRADDANTAMKRFNQAWLLDSTNATIYWGFGAATGIQHQYDTSLHFLQLALKHDPSKKKVLVDIGQTLLMRYTDKKQSEDLNNAVKSLTLFLVDSHDATSNFQTYQKLAAAYLLKQDYSNAWHFVDLAAALNPIEVQAWTLLPDLRKVAPRD